MRSSAGEPRRRGLVVPGLLALAAFALLVGLGTWQIGRKAWKDALIETLTERLATAPVDLPGRASWDGLDRAANEFRRVRFTAALEHEHEALVYAAGSALRSDATGPGYWVLTPARLRDGVVVVNRGYVPEGRQHPRTRSAGQITGAVEIVGALRWPEPRTWFTPHDDPGRNLWFVRDPAAIAAAKGYGPIFPFYLEQEAPLPPGGLPHPSALKANLRNDHLQYALTWYGLALVLVVVFVLRARSRVYSTKASKPVGDREPPESHLHSL